MKFLREPALQGASFLLSILLLILQFPNHFPWLFPSSILFIALLFLAHRLDESREDSKNREGFSLPKPNYARIVTFTRRWLTPGLTTIVILISFLLTINGIIGKFPFWKSFSWSRDRWVEQLAIEIPSNYQSIKLRTIVPNGRLYEILKIIDPEIVFSIDEKSNESANIIFGNRSLLVEDSGIDENNKLLEPKGDFRSSESTMFGDTYPSLFPLRVNHTIFIKMEDKWLIRIHIDENEVPFPVNDRTVLSNFILYISYIPDSSGRFEGLTAPTPVR